MYVMALVFFIYYFILAGFLLIDQVANTNLALQFQKLIDQYIISKLAYINVKDFLLGLFVADTLHFILDYSITYFNKFKKLFFGKFIKILSFKKN
jgi:uncharacterized metal-binding protein